MGAEVNAEAARRNDRAGGDRRKKVGIARETAEGAPDVDDVGPWRLGRRSLRGGGSREQHGEDEEEGYFVPFDLRRSAQYLRIRSDTALRASGDILRRARAGRGGAAA